MVVADIALRGAFHNPEHFGQVEPLLELLETTGTFKSSAADGESLGYTIARSMLIEKSNWPEQLLRSSWHQDSLAIGFGSAATMPPSLISRLGSQSLWQIPGFEVFINDATPPFHRLILAMKRTHSFQPDEYIAVVGMAVRTAGAKVG